MSLEWALLIALAAGWFASMLMNRGQFEGHYFLAAFVGALLFPYAAAFVAHTHFHRDMDPSVFAGLQPDASGQ